MTSPGRHGDTDPAVLSAAGGSEETQDAEQAVVEALAGLSGLDELPVSEHVSRFDAVHTALTDALSKAENLLSGSSSEAGS